MLDTCRRLKEKKSYMVYNAVGCLGVSALSDLVVEVFFYSIICVYNVKSNDGFMFIISLVSHLQLIMVKILSIYMCPTFEYRKI